MNYLHRARRKALVLSPAASHPQNYGNRRRVFQTTDQLRQWGYEIHFLLYPMEPDWMDRVQESERDMRQDWDSFAIIPSSRPLPLQTPPASGEYHFIDEWWDPAIDTYLSWLFSHDFFDAFVVNYAFLSKAFEFAPPDTVKILETHDRFSGRKELLASLKARLESFYTTEEEEARALARSDVVVAIKDSEADFYRTLTDRRVISVPFSPELQPALPDISDVREAEASAPLRVGFIGALNVVNVANMQMFLEAFEKIRDVYAEPVMLDIAGEVCLHLQTSSPYVRLLGRVETLDSFYDSLDVVIAPMMLSTGLKIKVAEALSYGKAVVATENGFDGFPVTDEFQSLPSLEAVCRALVSLSIDRDRLNMLRQRCVTAAQLARNRARSGYRALKNSMTRHLPTTIVLTDKAIHNAASIESERLAQWCQTCSQFGNVIVCWVANGETRPFRTETKQVDIIAFEPGANLVSNLLECVDELDLSFSVMHVVISLTGGAGPELWRALKARFPFVALDAWVPDLAEVARDVSGIGLGDVWVSDGASGEAGTRITATPFPRLPASLSRWREGAPGRGWLVVQCGPDASDRLGAELLESRSKSDRPIRTINLASGPDLPLDDSFLERLQTVAKPEMILALGTHAHAISLCAGIATAAAIPCLTISSQQFPYLLAGSDGSARLCSSYSDLVQCAIADDVLITGLPQNRRNMGWSDYEKLLAAHRDLREAAAQPET
jgi:glycosyltransferase involved in cell wall biosynthesis